MEQIKLDQIKVEDRFLCAMVSQASSDIPRIIVEFKCLETSDNYIKVKNMRNEVSWINKNQFDNTSEYGIHGFYILEILK